MVEKRFGTDDRPSKDVEFAEWKTSVEFDELQLVDLRFQSTTAVGFPQEGFTLSIPRNPLLEKGCLEATFLSRQKRAIVTFRFDAVAAFRVLDEHGLLNIWASPNCAKPAPATFRVKGHQWQKKSFLVWFHGADEDRVSWMIATGWECLEVVTDAEPAVTEEAAIVADYDPSDFD